MTDPMVADTAEDEEISFSPPVINSMESYATLPKDLRMIVCAAIDLHEERTRETRGAPA